MLTDSKARFREDMFFRAIRELRGRVLELGCAGGETLLQYGPSADVVGIDTWTAKTIRLFQAISEFRKYRSVHWAVADCKALPFKASSFDAVVAAFAFCSFDEPEKSSQEVRRVLKSGGKLYLLEHVAPYAAALRPPMRLASVVHHNLLRRCHLARSPHQILKQTGWKVTGRYSCGKFVPWEVVVATSR